MAPDWKSILTLVPNQPHAIRRLYGEASTAPGEYKAIDSVDVPELSADPSTPPAVHLHGGSLPPAYTLNAASEAPPIHNGSVVTPFGLMLFGQVKSGGLVEVSTTKRFLLS